MSERQVSEDLSGRTTDDFHRLYYDSLVWWSQTHWRGVPTQKCPLDLWIYQEILQETRPDLIIETGTADGGSAYYLASICDLLDCGMVISVDLERRSGRPRHPRIAYLEGRSSTDPRTLTAVRGWIVEPGHGTAAERIMVILDSDHSRDHVLAELEAYAPLVTSGQYLIVEDTNVNGNPVLPEHGPGPAEALQDWLPGQNDFEVDLSREKFGLTFNPGGYLRRR